ncbi:MAG: GNAT family N-acetyltransferase [Deltaproteobacteria bacterium]|nr:GNAT family N-acetyltransferase [Deltaproteobacteria bacterium]
MEIRPARAADLAAAQQLLREAKLPWEDVAPHFAAFLVGERGGALVACAGLEYYGEVALVRSVAIAETLRNAGLGAALCDTLLGDARRRGVRDAYLLTTTAPRFFARMGFAPIARDVAPPAIQRTREFTELCPASAAVMHRAL